MNKIKIREFSIDDYHDLIDLYKKSKLEFKPQGRDSYDHIKQQIQDNRCRFFLAFADNHLIGSVLATHDTRKGWINRLAVIPDYRRKKVATQLVYDAEKWLQDQGIEIFACLIEGWNKSSMKFFEELEYKKYHGVAYYTKRKYTDV